jgi:hypothetical protein
MKKSLLVFSILLAFTFITNFVAAQITLQNSITVVNNSQCTIWVMPMGYDLNCQNVCQPGAVTVGPNSSAVAAFPCPNVDALIGGFSTIIGFRDLAAGVAFKIGNGCGVNLSNTYIDCQGNTRTITFIPPNSVVVQ